MGALSHQHRPPWILRGAARVYLAPLAAIGVLMAAMLGLAAVLIVLQFAITVLRQFGA